MPSSSGKQRTRNRKLAAQTIASLKPGKWLTENFDYGEGALQVCGGTQGPRFYFRYTGPKGQARVKLPSFDGSGKPMTLAGARKHARALSARYQAGERDLRAAIEAEERERARTRAQAEKADQAAQEKESATLGALMEAYCDRQDKLGKADARGVRCLVNLHIRDAFPELWDRTAADITLDDTLEILGALTEAGKNRTAGKVRSYMRTAFSLALNSRRNAQLKTFKRFKMGANPAADIQPIEGANKSRDRALSVSELRALWQRLQDDGDPIFPALRFYLLTGGQRFAQLRRARRSDIADGWLTLWDAKGKRKQPRKHAVPLLPEATKAIKAMTTPRAGDFVFTLTNGATGADHAAAFKRVKKICNAMIEAGEITTTVDTVSRDDETVTRDEGEPPDAFKKRAGKALGFEVSDEDIKAVPVPFTISDLRRTVETRLAALKVPMDVRAQLQSHGLGGVQARHYDRHDYADEKLDALKKLRQLLTKAPAKVHRLHA